MSLAWVRVEFRGHGRGAPPAPELLKQLGLEANHGFGDSPSAIGWLSASAELMEVEFAEVEGMERSGAEFAARIDRGLRQVAEWLSALPVAAIEQWRDCGLELDLFVCWPSDADDLEVDLILPSELLLACGRLGIPIQLYANE
jgi:hypothetical protein